MKAIDRLLQRWRYRCVCPYLGADTRVLDVGCADGVLFRRHPYLRGGMGIDPTLSADGEINGNRLVRGFFPDVMPDVPPFDVIALTAVLEHIPEDQLGAVAQACARWLGPGGHLDGMSLEEHHGFDVRQVPAIFAAAGLEQVRRTTFQLGLNNLFVYRKPLEKRGRAR